jgi:hypothetical protein
VPSVAESSAKGRAKAIAAVKRRRGAPKGTDNADWTLLETRLGAHAHRTELVGELRATWGDALSLAVVT